MSNNEIQPTPEQKAAMDNFVRTLRPLPNPFDRRPGPESGINPEAAEKRAMVLAINCRNAEIMHIRQCPHCSEPHLCPRGQELAQAAYMAPETVMELILGEPTAEDIERAAQALRDAFKKVNG